MKEKNDSITGSPTKPYSAPAGESSRINNMPVPERWTENSREMAAPSSLKVGSRKTPRGEDPDIPNLRDGSGSQPAEKESYKGKTPKGPPAWQD